MVALVMLRAIGMRLGDTAKRFRATSRSQVGSRMPCQNRGAQKGYAFGREVAAGGAGWLAVCMGAESVARVLSILV